MVDIYGTLGPQCSDTDTLEAMFRAGMTGMRLNLSHTTLPEAAGPVHNLHTAAECCGVAAQLVIDMQGPELRVGSIPEPMTLADGERVLLGENGVPVPALTLPYLVPGQQVLLDDGKLLLTVLEHRGHAALAKVERGGLLRGRKSIALPGFAIRPPVMTESDIANIRMAKEYGVTGVMQPFVRGRSDLETVRRALDDAGQQNIRVFAKIENMDGVESLGELIPAADEIVIARGDLGNAMPLWELPAVQKRIAARCREAGRPFMVATQMLTSMEKNPVPTRAEVSDIFNAVLDGASSVIVTGETAVGLYPAESIRYLANTARAACTYLGQVE